MIRLYTFAHFFNVCLKDNKLHLLLCLAGCHMLLIKR